jgi:RNA polymerase sigma-70 factor (ECF subfamily)
MKTHEDTREGLKDNSDELVKEILAGDDKAFDQLVRLHQGFVFNLCYRLMGDYDDADDCAQEVFIKVARSLKGFKFKSSFKTWLYRVTANTCKSKLNSLEYRLRRRRTRLDMTGEENQKQPEIIDQQQSPEDDLKRKEINRLIQVAVNQLPPEQKLIVVLRDMEGRTYEEIMEIMGCKMGTVKSKLSRARHQLRTLLEGAI